MSGTSLKTFALIIPRFEDLDHSFYAEEIVKGVGLSASRLRVDILMHITERYDHQDWLSEKMTNRKQLDGIIFADIDKDTETLEKVIATGIPYVVLNNIFKEPINSIAVDNQKAAFDAVEYLIENGHKEIAIVCGDLRTQAGRLRLDGYKEALDKHGLDFKDEFIKYGEFLRTSSRKAAKDLFDAENSPTAIFACSDVMALEIMYEAKTRGMKVPQDISVIGFDDNPINVHSSVKLSTVAQPLKEMGRLGLEKLNQICEGEIGIPTQTLLPTKFIARASVFKLA